MDTPTQLTPDALAAYQAQREKNAATNERAREECERVWREVTKQPELGPHCPACDESTELGDEMGHKCCGDDKP